MKYKHNYYCKPPGIGSSIYPTISFYIKADNGEKYGTYTEYQNNSDKFRMLRYLVNKKHKLLEALAYAGYIDKKYDKGRYFWENN